MTMNIKYSLQIKRSPRGMGKAFSDGRAETFKEIGEVWHKKYLRRHFQLSAFREYGYAKRSKRYEQRKLKRFGHMRPLVYTGRMQRALTGSALVRSSARGVTVRMTGPKWLKGFMSMLGRYGTGPDKAKEVTTISEREGNELAAMAGDILTRKMERAKT